VSRSPKPSAAKRASYRREAVKIAGHVRYGAATPPLVFPAQLTGLPSRSRVGSVYYQPDAGVLRASRFALTTGTPDLGADGGLEFQTNLPSFTDFDPATWHRNFCGQPATPHQCGQPVQGLPAAARRQPGELDHETHRVSKTGAPARGPGTPVGSSQTLPVVALLRLAAPLAGLT
jgi:hypothetical protein